MSGRLTKLTIRALDAAARLALPAASIKPHIATGQRGEEDAYFYLRTHGYCMVARNYRSPRRSGEIDLIGWDDGMLCFIEVKTRSTRDVKPAEAAVNRAKQEEIVSVAHQYLRRLPARTPARCDIVSVYYEGQRRSPQITLFKNAFPMR
jgi:putative endonuclease